MELVKVLWKDSLLYLLLAIYNMIQKNRWMKNILEKQISEKHAQMYRHL